MTNINQTISSLKSIIDDMEEHNLNLYQAKNIITKTEKQYGQVSDSQIDLLENYSKIVHTMNPNELSTDIMQTIPPSEVTRIKSLIKSQPDLAKNILSQSLQKEIILIKATALIRRLESSQMSGGSVGDDYSQAFAAVLFHRTGPLNNYDEQLIDYCTRINLDSTTIVAIYLADRKADIEGLIKQHLPSYQAVLLNILRLKKLSAEKKFRINYGITDASLQTLLANQSVWI